MQSQPDNSIRTTPGVSVHGGFPNPATDTRLQSLDLNQLLIQHTASTFLMRIEGSEWQALGIFAGDIALIDKALTPQHSDVVTWWHDGAFAVSTYATVHKEATVWGVVTTVIHQFRKPV